MKAHSFTTVLFSVLLLVACKGARNPAAPYSPASHDVAEWTEWEGWSVTQRLTASRAPGDCLIFGGAAVGTTWNWETFVRRRGDYLEISDGENVLVGRVSGPDFAVEGKSMDVFCAGDGDAPNYGNAKDLITGRFAADGAHIEAVRTVTRRLASGADVSYTFEWTASLE